MIETPPTSAGEMTSNEVEGSGEGGAAAACFDEKVVVNCLAGTSFSPPSTGGVGIVDFCTFVAVSSGVAVAPSLPPVAAAVELVLKATVLVSPPTEGFSSLGGWGERIERAVM